MVYGRETQLEIVRGQLFEAINKLAPQFKTKKQSAEELAQTRGLAEQLLKQLVASVMRVKNPGLRRSRSIARRHVLHTGWTTQRARSA